MTTLLRRASICAGIALSGFSALCEAQDTTKVVSERMPVRHVVAAQELESDLTLEGIDRLEVVLHMRAMNAREPKSLYRQ